MTTYDAHPCPLCDCWKLGAPEPARGGGVTSEQWGELAWKNRLDVGGFVCAGCDETLGPDTVRSLLLKRLEK